MPRGDQPVIEVRHSADPTCVELAALAAMTLRCEAVQDTPEGDDRSVRLLVDGRQVASVYVGGSPRSSEWVSAMAARLAGAVNDVGFGGSSGVRALHAAHGVDAYEVRAIKRAKLAARAEDRRGERLELGTEAVPETESVTADDRGGE